MDWFSVNGNSRKGWPGNSLANSMQDGLPIRPGFRGRIGNPSYRKVESCFSVSPIDACTANQRRATGGSPVFKAFGVNLPITDHADINRVMPQPGTLIVTLLLLLSLVRRSVSIEKFPQRALFPNGYDGF